jgi:predicted lipoprotein with Yx(FWY)xxD motif
MNTISTFGISRGLARTLLTTGAAALVLGACGGDDPAPLSEPAAPATASAQPVATTQPAAPAPVDAAVKISQTELGDVLSDPNGMTLYAFTNDVDAASTCSGTCAEAWPPVIVDPDFIVSPGLDSGIFATTQRADGSSQLVAGKWPLYLYAADAKPGDITGQGSGDVWYAVDTSGRLIGGAAESGSESGSGSGATVESGAAYGDPAGVTAAPATEPAAPPAAPPAASPAAPPAEVEPVLQLADTEFGGILTDATGMTLYLFTPDEAGSPTCVDGCAQAWPPLLVDDVTELLAADGIDASTLSTVEHPNGGRQLKIGKWPLYTFAGDAAPGDTTGQGSGGTWFVVGADGKSIK